MVPTAVKAFFQGSSTVNGSNKEDHDEIDIEGQMYMPNSMKVQVSYSVAKFQ